jgi:hypothetical protein
VTPGERTKLVAILGRLGSDFDGERAAAGLLASRMLKTIGASWDDVVRSDQGGPAGRTNRPSPSWAPPWHSDVALCQRHEGWLRPWERGFIASVAARQRLSRKQLAILRDIARELRARGAR